MPAKPTLFLSYCRAPSADLARYIRDRLVSLGVDVFFDVEDINAGRFAEIIEKEIINREHFLVILTPTTLESDWVRREIQTALKHRRNIIPMLAQGFTFSKLPNEIQELADFSGIPYDFQDPDRAFVRISKAIGVKKQQHWLRAFWNIGGNPTLIGWVTILGVILAFSGLTLTSLFNRSNQTTAILPTFMPTSLVADVMSPTMVLPSPTYNSSPTLTATPIPATRTAPTIPPTVDLPKTIMASTDLANAQSTAAMAIVSQYYTQTATLTTLTLLPSATVSTIFSQQSNASDYTPTIETDPDSGYAFVVVPAGEFADTRGTASDRIQIGVYTVTNAQFATFMNNHGNTSDGGEKRLNDSYGDVQIHIQGSLWKADTGLENYPVIQVTWNGAQDYCKLIDARLPTSTELHKTATWNPTTHKTTVYPWGDTPPTKDQANFGNANSIAKAVDSYPAGKSAIGAYNLSGNVWQWTATQVGTNVIRVGGAWDSASKQLRWDTDDYSLPSASANNVGFRCAR